MADTGAATSCMGKGKKRKKSGMVKFFEEFFPSPTGQSSVAVKKPSVSPKKNKSKSCSSKTSMQKSAGTKKSKSSSSSSSSSSSNEEEKQRKNADAKRAARASAEK